MVRDIRKRSILNGNDPTVFYINHKTMMTDLLQKNAIPFDDQGQQVCVYLNHI